MSSMADLGILSPEGRCYSFDSRANGYGRGEGVGVVVLKLLSRALSDGDTIRGIVRSTGSSHDGRTPGIMQPSSDAQTALIKRTYSVAGLDLGATRYFEAHATGTPVGDPIEFNAIRSTFAAETSQGRPLYIGTLKPNIGHLEASAGVAALIKAVLVLEKAVIPPNANLEKLNERISVGESNLKVLCSLDLVRNCKLDSDDLLVSHQSHSLADPGTSTCVCQCFWIWRLECACSP